MSAKASNSKYSRYGKRLFDLALTIPGLILIFPVLAIIALLVRVKLGSPVLFQQTRPRLHGKLFLSDETYNRMLVWW